MRKQFPGWLVDLLLALLLAGVGLLIERLTDGRLWTATILWWVGGGSFLLLRLGARLAQAGRTLGCAFVLGITWLLPCVTLLYMMSNDHLQRVVRDSTPFFAFLGFVLILVMLVTFERLRLADERRHRAGG